ncbi:O-antigen ligase family protein [Pelagicoccus sp. SDUM812003]|uniref:O-antigen ligase family protein n=1 Tax=Pelagicoccus sp. SDUM812003 TaxID=3041267 RepID=UPI00280EC875|nr:O-antigen ligase family protein [Pelagicoccus sp. SDUM812003]MDQ8203599.1 O-antigen ligase family protein [Pelagicoccus sp. SDUM812003]
MTYDSRRSYAGPVEESSDGGYLAKAVLVTLFAWALLGKQLLFMLAIVLNVPTRVLTIPSHMATVGLALASVVVVFFATRFRYFPLHWIVLPFSAFWMFYFMRIVIDYQAQGSMFAPPKDATYSVSYIAQKAIGTCLLPSVAVLLNTHWAAWRKTQTVCFTMAVLIAGSFFAIYRENIFSFSGRMNPGDETGDFATISSLQLGYSGLVLLIFFLFMYFSERPKNVWKALLLYSVGAVGMLLIVGSASRGPVVGFVFMAVPFGFSLFFRGEPGKFIKFVVGVATFGAIALIAAQLTGSSVFDRLLSIHHDVVSQSDQSDRLVFYENAWNSFLESPIIGSQSSLGGYAYPHNLILESLMAVGIVGTIPLLVVIGYAFYCSWALLVRYPKLGWLSLAFYAYFCGSLFSGSLFSNAAFWISMAGTISAYQWAAREMDEQEEEEALRS